MIVTLPSGLTGEVRGLTGRDGRYLSNEKLVQDNEIEDYVLRGCWMSTLDSGPYTLVADKIDWKRALIGDRTVAMLHIRNATYPDDPYDIPMKCQNQTCGSSGKRTMFHWEVDLAELIKKKVKNLPKASADAVRSSQKISIIIPGTTTAAKFLPINHEDRSGWLKWREQLRALSKQNQKKHKEDTLNDLVSAPVFWNLEIDGITKLLDKMEFLEDLPLRSIRDLTEIVEAADCGIDTELEIECPKCGHSWLINLPFTRRFFVPPSRASMAQTEKTQTESPPEETPDPLET